MKQLRNPTLFAVATLCIVALFYVHDAAAQATPGAQGGRGPQSAPPFKKRILVVGAAKGFEHDSIPYAMGTVWKMGQSTGMWEAYLRTDYELITKGKVGRNGKNLNEFDAIVFANSTGEMELSDDQKRDLLSYVHDDGKGFVGIHAALDSNYKWPEYAEMIGGWFDEHPWVTFDAPIILEVQVSRPCAIFLTRS